MKKVGIVTFHRAENNGAMLQAYALQRTINDLGNEAFILDYRDKNIEDKYSIIKLKNKNLKLKIREIVVKCVFFITNLRKKNKFKRFLKKYYNLTNEQYNTNEELKSNYPRYIDCFVAGSDQIWNEKITNGLQDVYTLNFGDEKTKRISYAASIGKSDISEEELERLKEKLEMLDEISVREESAKDALKKVINKEISISLDPTLLLNKDEWNEIAGEKLENEKYILVYTIENNPEMIKIVNYISEKTGLKVIHFDKKSKYANPLKSYYVSGPREFINLIKNAELVVTNSFHGTVFSVIFEKKFYTIPHTTVGSRMIDLLKKLKLDNRIYYNVDQIKSIKEKDITSDINYEEAEEILKKVRKESIDYLMKI